MRDLAGAVLSIALASACAADRSLGSVEVEAPAREAPAPRPRPDGPAPSCERIGGSRENLTTTAGIDAPTSCDGGRTYWVRVAAPTGGRRKLRYRARGEKPAPSACDAATADPVACPTADAEAFGTAVMNTLSAALNKTSPFGAEGLGLGACGRVGGSSLADWNLSTQVHDWRDVDDAVHIVADELRRWHLADDWGITVGPVRCAVAL